MATRPFLMAPASQKWFRLGTLLFAGIVGLYAVWLLAAESFRHSLQGVATDSGKAAVASPQRKVASTAARLGLVRGDLWARSALTYSELLWSEAKGSPDAETTQMIDQAEEAADRALRFAPHDARVWLILAGLYSQFDWLYGKSADALRMSYYTGANEVELIPLRILLAARSDALADSELQTFVQRDIRIIITRKPELKSAIGIAYRDALPAGRSFIERTLGELDPGLLKSLQSGH